MYKDIIAPAIKQKLIDSEVRNIKNIPAETIIIKIVAKLFEFYKKN